MPWKAQKSSNALELFISQLSFSDNLMPLEITQKS